MNVFAAVKTRLKSHCAMTTITRLTLTVQLQENPKTHSKFYNSNPAWHTLMLDISFLSRVCWRNRGLTSWNDP